MVMATDIEAEDRLIDRNGDVRCGLGDGRKDARCETLVQGSLSCSPEVISKGAIIYSCQKY